MKVQNWQRAHEFFLEHRNTRSELLLWKKTVQAAEWKNFADVKKTFGHRADIYEDDWWIFDIKNNDIRLVAILEFDGQQVWIRHVMTHEEYDSNKWKLEKKQNDEARKTRQKKKGGETE